MLQHLTRFAVKSNACKYANKHITTTTIRPASNKSQQLFAKTSIAGVASKTNILPAVDEVSLEYSLFNFGI